jgi:DNA invertase Pin-like site-specific DNA recombinase
MHPIDLPMLTMRPDDPLTAMVLQMLMVFATFERQMLSQRTREAVRWRKSLGRRVALQARKGFKWVRRGDGKEYEEVDPKEAAHCIRALELTAMGYTQHQIADYLNQECGAKNRFGKPYRQQNIGIMVQSGIVIMKQQGIPLPEGIESREDLIL